jgi:hypothetical protein
VRDGVIPHVVRAAVTPARATRAEPARRFGPLVAPARCLDLGTDHYARLAAGTRLVQVLAARGVRLRVLAAKRQHVHDAALTR